MPKKYEVEIPEELKRAGKDVKEAFVQKMKISEQLDNHPLRYYDVPDKNGETVKVDCLGIWKNNIKKIERLGAYSIPAEKEIRKRSEVLKDLKRKKAECTFKINAYLNRHVKGKSVLDFRKDEILEAFGEYKSIDQIHDLIREWGFSIVKNKITEFYYANIDEIQDRRLRFQAREKDFYLSTTTGRVESLSFMFQKLMKLFDEKPHVTKYASEIRAIIAEIRKEIKGDEIRLTVDGKIDLTATMQANLTIQELNQKLPINLFIVGLVAAKKGIDPKSIMAQLGNSFYANYNGFSEIKDDEQIRLPSHFIKSYNWGEIEALHAEKQEKATKKLYNQRLSKFFADNGVKYEGNVQSSLQQLQRVLSGEAVPDIIDIEPLETSVKEEKQMERVLDARTLLQQILEERKKSVQ